MKVNNVDIHWLEGEKAVPEFFSYAIIKKHLKVFGSNQKTKTENHLCFGLVQSTRLLYSHC